MGKRADKAGVMHGTMEHTVQGAQAQGVQARASEQMADASRQIDWRRKTSDHIAYGLLVYTGLHIFVTTAALKPAVAQLGPQLALLPYLSLIVLVLGIIPVARGIERRWDAIGDDEAGDPAHAPAFRRDVAVVWLGAIGLPLGLSLLMKWALA